MVILTVDLLQSAYNQGIATNPVELLKLGLELALITVTSAVLIGFVLSKIIKLMLGKVS